MREMPQVTSLIESMEVVFPTKPVTIINRLAGVSWMYYERPKIPSRLRTKAILQTHPGASIDLLINKRPMINRVDTILR